MRPSAHYGQVHPGRPLCPPTSTSPTSFLPIKSGSMPRDHETLALGNQFAGPYNHLPPWHHLSTPAPAEFFRKALRRLFEIPANRRR